MNTVSIKTKAELKRLPVGTKLQLIHTLLGPTKKIRVIKKVASNYLILTTEDNKDSYLYLSGKFESTKDGFRILEDSRIAAEYLVYA